MRATSSKISSSADRRFLRRALELAALGSGLTFPNPRVGAVLVRGGRIIGEGFHRRAGTPHAEVHAVRAAKRAGHTVAGATLYVSLEPCSTRGRTPPCTGLILREKIARVVFAATDPNPPHAGAATKLLRAAGVAVSSGLLAKEAAALNRDFNWWIIKKLSLDGRIVTSPADDRWLTSPEARRAAHELRWESDAILVGAETARRDDPKLTVRLPGRRGKKQPIRVVVTRSGNLPRSLQMFTDPRWAETRVFHGRPLPEVMRQIGAHEITHVLIEGGGQVLTEAFRAGLVNEVAFFIAPALMGTIPRALHSLKKEIALREVSCQRVGPDLLCRALVVR
jgi:diaminohydroxyphosphoribosylaminopyrimidine deaminase/5-amino-6-(5-phosphoribosylamino)uracil reductase